VISISFGSIRSVARCDKRDVDEARRGFLIRLRRKGFSTAFIERHGDDLFGQALLELSEALDAQVSIHNAAGWLINCSWRRTQNLLDRERRRPQSVPVDADSLASSATTEKEVLERDDVSTFIDPCSLPPKERRLIELIYGEGMSCREAGRAVGLGKSAADRHHHAALARLRPFVTR
jgi:RNA polymerase sigma factor (sigma-70 family)